jgi:hypothetical protein
MWRSFLRTLSFRNSFSSSSHRFVRSATCGKSTFFTLGALLGTSCLAATTTLVFLDDSPERRQMVKETRTGIEFPKVCSFVAFANEHSNVHSSNGIRHSTLKANT